MPSTADLLAIPAANRATSPQSAKWCKRLFDHANKGGTLADVACAFGLSTPETDDYSMPVNRATPSTPDRRVFYRPGWPGRFATRDIGRKIPWDGRPSGGKDGHAVVIDLDGTEYDLWGLSSAAHQSKDRPQSGVLGNLYNWLKWPPFNAKYDLVAASLVEQPDEGNGEAYILPQLSAGTTTPEEVASGDIGHALRLAIANPLAGPSAPKTIDSPDHPDVGKLYAIAGQPCAIQESTRPTNTTLTDVMRQQLLEGVPHGLQVVAVELDVDRYLDERQLVGTLRETTGTIANAVATHGFVCGLTSDYPAYVQFDGSRPDAWRDLGIRDDGRDLLSGLIADAGMLRALDWPLGIRADGTTTRRAGTVVDWRVP